MEEWKSVNARRIGEKAQEIRLYCAQKRDDMTPRAFELARLSFDRLLDNIFERNIGSAAVVNNLRSSMSADIGCIANCSEKQADFLAKSIVYNYIGDDLNLYPVTAEKKLSRSKAMGYKECNIPIDDMTIRDRLYTAYAIVKGENSSKSTMLAVYDWFKAVGLEPIEARVFSYLFIINTPVSLLSMPQAGQFLLKYRQTARALVEKGFIGRFSEDVYCITESCIE